MDISIYTRSVEASLSSKPVITSVDNFKINRITQNRAQIRARVYFFDNSYLDIREMVDTDDCSPKYSKYSYQYIKDDEQVFRYDNAPDHPNLDTFPHHKHIGSDDDNNIVPSSRPSFREIFREISQHFS